MINSVLHQIFLELNLSYKHYFFCILHARSPSFNNEKPIENNEKIKLLFEKTGFNKMPARPDKIYLNVR